MIKGKRTIYVLHVERQSVQGRHNYSVDLGSGTQVSLGRVRAKGIKIPFGFVKRKGTNILDTGLDVMIENPYYSRDLNELDQEFKPGSNWVDKYDSIKDREQIDKQTYYEILDNVPQGYYTSVCNMRTMVEIGADAQALRDSHPTFLEKFSVFLNEGVNTFPSTSQRGRLGQLVCERHPKIANSRDLINPDYHEFYIGSAEEATIEKNRKIDKVMDAIADLREVQRNYSQFTSYQLAVVLDLLQGDSSDATVELTLKDYIWESKKTNKGKQEERLSNFRDKYDLLKNDPDRLYIQYLIKQALNTGVFLTSGTRHIMWPNKKGIDNLYDLGTNMKKIERMFFEQLELYDPSIDADNWFADLERELKMKGVRTK